MTNTASRRTYGYGRVSSVGRIAENQRLELKIAAYNCSGRLNFKVPAMLRPEPS